MTETTLPQYTEGHRCDTPEALAHDSDSWTCPTCGKQYERSWDAWWEEAGRP